MAKKYKVLEGPISLRKSSDKTDPLYEEWFNWRKGDVFDPPAHLKTIGGLTLNQAVKAGLLEVVGDDDDTEAKVKP